MGDERRWQYRPWDEPVTTTPLADLEALRESVREHSIPIEEWKRRLEKRRELIHELMAANGMDPARVLPASHFFLGTQLAHDPLAPDGSLWWDEVIAIVPAADGPLVAAGMPVEEVRRRYPHAVVPGGLKL